jgi:iron complex outermembrane receptor protein
MAASAEKSVWVLSALAFTLSVPAASAQSEQSLTEPFITVTSPRLERNLYDTPAAVSVTDAPDIREGQQRLQLDESLDTVPGLFFQNRYNFAQNLRLSTRGFGARAPFGIRGIRIQVDGIPYTLPASPPVRSNRTAVAIGCHSVVTSPARPRPKLKLPPT